MKKLITLFFILSFTLIGQAQVSKTVDISTAGTLSTYLTSDELNTVTNLTITGTIDARDFKTMRDDMPLLEELDLSGTTIVAYTGTEGTAISGNYNYLENAIPDWAFFNTTTYAAKIKLKTFIFPISATYIGQCAFQECTGLITVSLTSSITTIGGNAFYGCSGLLGTLTIPSTVNNIGVRAYGYCIGLTSISISSSTTDIGQEAFSACKAPITVDTNNPNYSSIDGVLYDKMHTILMQCPTSKTGSFVIPSSVAIIGVKAFNNCSGITLVDIPLGVTTIEFAAFANLNGLTSIILPASLISIGQAAFMGCNNLTSITIPSSVTSIGEMAFASCSNLTSIYSYSFTPINLSASANVFSGVDKSTCTLYVPYGTKAAYQAASQWQDFTNIVEAANGFILSSITANIAATAGSTASVNVTANVAWTASSDQTWLSVNPASGTGNQTLTFTAEANSSIGTRTAIITVSAPDVETQTITITQAGSDAPLAVTAGGLATALTAEELASVTNLTITGTIDARDFITMRDAMPALAILDLSGVTIDAYNGTAGTAGVKAFLSPAIKTSAKTGLDDPLNRIRPQQIKMQIGMAVTDTYPANEIPEFAFSNPNTWNGKASLKSIIMPNSITSIGNSAFTNCTGLSSVTLPGSVTSIGEYAFYACFSLTSIILPSTVSTIGQSAFGSCSSLTEVNIPSSVTTIGGWAFSETSSLTGALTIPSTVSSIGQSAFRSSSALLTVATDNPNYSSLDGVLFNKTKTTLIQCPTSKTGTYIIPSSVITIGDEAFSRCLNLTTVSIPMSVISIGNGAFWECWGLTSFSIPSSVTSIGSYAFYGCWYLTTINIPISVSFVGGSAFLNCTDLTSIYAYSATPVDLTSSTNVFDSVNKNTCTLYVPYASKAAYQAASQWQDFTNIVEAANGFNLSAVTVYIGTGAGSTATVNITANVTWTATSDQSWLTVNPGSGSGNGILTLTSASQSQTLRTAIVTVSSPDYASQTITVLESNGLTYCTAGSNKAGEYISNVTIGSINQTSTIGAAGYQDYTSLITTMQKGVNTTATITVTNPYPSDQVLIWIDWNQDGDFDEAGENVYASTGSFASPHTTANFAPPVDAKTGITRMRIRLHDTGAGPNATSCGNYDWGEVEDYTINVSGLDTKIEQTELYNSIKVYPNPVSNELIIEFDGSISFEILNVMGQVVFNGNLIKTAIVQTANLSPGVYVIKFEQGKSFAYKKFIKR